MQSDLSATPRRVSPHRLGSQTGAAAKGTAQRHHQALRNCLEACQELGFNAGAEDSTASSTPTVVCQLVDTATSLSELRTEAAFRSYADLFGKLLDPHNLADTVSRLSEAQSSLEYIRKNQDCLVNFLQQPLPALTVESGGQEALLKLLEYAATDGQTLGKGLEDFSWVMKFKEPVNCWSKLLQPTPQAAMAAIHYHEGLAATQEALESIASRWIQKGSLEGNEMDTSLAANASA